MKDQVTKILDDILAILDRDGKTIVDFAKELGRDYNQVYDWIKGRKFNPQADNLLILMAWRDKNFNDTKSAKQSKGALG